LREREKGGDGDMSRGTAVILALDQAGAVLRNRHFVYRSSKHGSAYVDLDPVLPDVELMSLLCSELGRPFLGEIDTVAAPATGGIPLAVLTAKALGESGASVASVWADKQDGELAFRRAGFKRYLANRRVLVVDDLLTTGGSISEVCRGAEQYGANIVGVSVVCNRGKVTASHLGVPRLESLADIDFDAVSADECDLCIRRVPIVEDVGYGMSFKRRYPDHVGGYVRLHLCSGVNESPQESC
jgi:orotate phosphoribosyltransferase